MPTSVSSGSFAAPRGANGSPAFGASAEDRTMPFEAPAPARKRSFASFERYTIPTPPPGKWRFYWDELKANYKISMALGEQRYNENLKTDRHTRLKFVVFTALFAGAYAVMRRLRRSFMYVVMLGMLAKPIKDFNRTMPQMEEAYREMKRGNPTRAREIFAFALDDTIYTLMHDFMKPLTFGIIGGILLGLPSVLRGEGTGFLNRLLRIVGRGIGLKPAHPVIRHADRLMKRPITWGDSLCNRLLRRLPFLHHLEI